MRREGFEMTVSPPKVLIKEDDNGKKDILWKPGKNV